MNDQHVELKNFQERYVLEHMVSFRTSRPEVFCKKSVLRNFTKFTGKHLCQGLFFNKVAGTPFFTEHLWWLFLPL